MSTPHFGRPPGRIRRRWFHRMGWYRNEMRRTSDRWETALVALLLAVFLVVLPFVAAAAAGHAYHDALRQQDWNHAHRLHTEAVLLADAAAPATADGAATTTDSTVAAARWTAPDGTTREGPVEAVPGQRAGTHVGLWMDDQGRPTAAPDYVYPVADAINDATFVVLGGALVLVTLRVLLRILLHRRRLRSWQQEWLEVGPRWSRHR